jgi:hypothetical protein
MDLDLNLPRLIVHAQHTTYSLLQSSECLCRGPRTKAQPSQANQPPADCRLDSSRPLPIPTSGAAAAGETGGMATASSFAAVFFSSAFAACFAEVCTIPLDTAKVCLQLQRKTPSLPPPLASAAAGGGTLATILCIAREEGVAALWKGIIPGLHRQFLYGGLRIGLYEPVCTSPHSYPSLLLQFKGTYSQQQSETSLSSFAGESFLCGGYFCD